MRIDHVYEPALDAATAAGIGALLDLCFDGGFGKRGHFLLRHHLRMLVRDNGRIVGHLALALRTMRLGSRLIDTATIAEVATAPDRRGEGIAAALLAEAVDVALGTDAEYALLFGDAGLYGAAGFRKVCNRVRRIDMAGQVTRGVVEAPADDLMVLRLRDTHWDETLLLDLLGTKF